MKLRHLSFRRSAPVAGHRLTRALLPLVALFCLVAAVGAAGAAVPEAPALPGRLVYNRAKAYQWNLFTSDADGRNEGQLTAAKSPNSKGDEQPRWSWDGRQIAFANFSQNGDKAFIWRVPFTGGTPTPVATVNAEEAGFPSWGPGENTIVFSGAHVSGGASTVDLMVWTPEGVRTLLDTAGSDEREPDWSRDGRHITYAARSLDGSAPPSSIRVVNADGSGDHAVFALAGQSACHPRWSPDGSRLAIVTYGRDECLGSGTLWLLEVDANRLTEVVRSGVSFPAAWSSDGEYLLVYNTLHDGLVFPDQPTPTTSPPSEQLLGLYLLRLSDMTLFRLRDAAGGAGGRNWEWGQYHDWTAGTYTPTPEASLTPTSTIPPPTATPTLTPSPSATSVSSSTPTASRTAPATASGTATPTETRGIEITPTSNSTPDPLPPLYLPVAHKSSNGIGIRR